MKKLLLISFLFAAISAFAQQITFQGKLYQNGQPVNAIGNFNFIVINPNNISWSETHNNVTVNNGLYAVVMGSITPLPLNLFENSNSVEMAVRYNGNWIDTVTIYSPFERDYTVPDSIKDGISWNEVSNKPTLDLSNTNELQTLSISNDSLYITQGNGVKLPAGTGGGGNNNTVIGNFTVFDTTSTAMPNVGQTSNCSQDAFSTTVWQSFLCTSSGRLRAIRLQLGSISGNAVNVTIYTGAGVSQALAGPVQVSITGGLAYRIIDVSSLNVPLTSGNIYSFALEPLPNGTQLVVGRNFLTADAYPNGVSSFGSNADLCFEIYTDHTNPSSFTVLNNGYVGIGNNNPTAQLQVNGRIKDVTGFLAPVGSVQAYAGNIVPEGWLLCDGRSVSRTNYADLFNAIGTAWGTANSSSFNLPDLRGMFLRGVDSSDVTGVAGKDPDRNTRAVANVGGNNGNRVGSTQSDEFKSHNHGIQTSVINSPSSGNQLWIANTGAWNTNFSSNSSGGSENRPKNAYVYYIIKY